MKLHGSGFSRKILADIIQPAHCLSRGHDLKTGCTAAAQLEQRAILADQPLCATGCGQLDELLVVRVAVGLQVLQQRRRLGAKPQTGNLPQERHALGNPNLSDKDALDIAAYVNTQPLPKFVLEGHLGKSK